MGKEGGLTSVGYRDKSVPWYLERPHRCMPQQIPPLFKLRKLKSPLSFLGTKIMKQACWNKNFLNKCLGGKYWSVCLPMQCSSRPRLSLPYVSPGAQEYLCTCSFFLLVNILSFLSKQTYCHLRVQDSLPPSSHCSWPFFELAPKFFRDPSSPILSLEITDNTSVLSTQCCLHPVLWLQEAVLPTKWCGGGVVCLLPPGSFCFPWSSTVVQSVRPGANSAPLCSSAWQFSKPWTVWTTWVRMPCKQPVASVHLSTTCHSSLT